MAAGEGIWQRELLPASPPTHLGDWFGGWAWALPRLVPSLPSAPRQKLDLERETIELVHTEPTDMAQLPARVPREAARYHFFLYKHTHEGEPLESVGEWRAGPQARGRGRGWPRGPAAHAPPRPRSVHLLHAGVQVQHQGAHAVL